MEDYIKPDWNFRNKSATAHSLTIKYCCHWCYYYYYHYFRLCLTFHGDIPDQSSLQNKMFGSCWSRYFTCQLPFVLPNQQHVTEGNHSWFIIRYQEKTIVSEMQCKCCTWRNGFGSVSHNSIWRYNSEDKKWQMMDDVSVKLSIVSNLLVAHQHI